MKYWQAVMQALFYGWGGILERDMATGNGFQICAYGFKLILGYLFYYSFRILIALTAPLSALLVMRLYKINKRYQREFDAQLERDLGGHYENE